MELTEIIRDLLLVEFKNSYKTTSTMLRFVEYYESPKFKGQVFTLDEFKEWYTKESPNGKETGKFTYYTDWGGYNLPSHIFEPFFEGKFDPLSKKEKKLLDLLEDRRGNEFYLVTMPKKPGKRLFKHEVSHGLYCLESEYQEQTKEVINNLCWRTRNRIRNKLLNDGYCDEVLEDEMQAYLLSDLKDMIDETQDKRGITKAHNKIKALYKQFYKKRKL